MSQDVSQDVSLGDDSCLADPDPAHFFPVDRACGEREVRGRQLFTVWFSWVFSDNPTVSSPKIDICSFYFAKVRN